MPARHLALVDAAVMEMLPTGGILIVELPVRHGKSWYCSKWLPAWFTGRFPDKRVIEVTHGAEFAAEWGRAAREIVDEYGQAVFGVSVSSKSKAANRWDIEGHQGGMITLGRGGSPIGRGGDLVVVDDPYGSYEDAMSPLVRRKVREWWTATMTTRLEPGALVVVLCSRWHDEDLPGFLQRTDDCRVIHLPAICVDEANDPLGRRVGEALWPEQWSVERLEEKRRKTSLELGDAVWFAQYQQSPRSPSGGMFTDAGWVFVPGLDVAVRMGSRWVRGWDLAATDGAGDWTAGVLMGHRPGGAREPEGRFCVADVVRGRWGSEEVRRRIVECVRSDPAGTVQAIPQDPGQAGKDQADQLRRLVEGAGGRCVTRPVSGGKELRAGGYSAQHQAGLIDVVSTEGETDPARRWNGAFVAEHTAFPTGAHDDQVDAAAEAYNVLVSGAAVKATVSRYDTGGWSSGRR